MKDRAYILVTYLAAFSGSLHREWWGCTFFAIASIFLLYLDAKAKP